MYRKSQGLMKSFERVLMLLSMDPIGAELQQRGLEVVRLVELSLSA